MKQQPAFRPIGDRYLVLPDEVKGQDIAVGEFTISTDKSNHKKAETGTVVARGRSCTEVPVGACVEYGQYSGYVKQIAGKDHIVLRESELLGEWCDTPFDREPVDLRLIDRNQGE